MAEEQQAEKIEIYTKDDEHHPLNTFSAGVWCMIFHHAGLKNASQFAQTAKGVAHQWYKYLNESQFTARDIVIARKILPVDLLDHAHACGISVDYILLLQHYQRSYEMIERLRLSPNEDIWVIAGLCGDQTWLVNNKKNEFCSLVDIHGVHVLEYLGFAGHGRNLSTLHGNRSISSELVKKYRASMIEYTALGGHERCLVNWKRTKDQGAMRKLLAGGHLKLALKYFSNEINLLANDKETLNIISLSAAQRAHFAVCDHLETLGAYPHYIDPTWGFSQIHFAARFDDVERVRKLLPEDPKNNLPKDKQGKSPICYAAIGGAKNTFLFLLQFNPENAERMLLNNDNPFALLASHRHACLLKALPEVCQFNPKMIDARGQNLLFSTAVSGCWDDYVFLRTEYSLEDKPNNSGTSVLMTSFANGRMRFIEHYLNEKGNECLRQKDHYQMNKWPVSYWRKR